MMNFLAVLTITCFSLSSFSQSMNMGGMHKGHKGHKGHKLDYEQLLKSAKTHFKVLPKVKIQNKKVFSLGKKLYFETRLSKSNKISCNSCHNVKTYGVDNEPTSPGHNGQRGDRNSPTSFNAFLHLSQFWDGRAKDVEEQAVGPIFNPIEMAMPNEASVLDVLNGDKTYVSLFKKAFPKEKDPVSINNVGKAIGAFERGLLTPSKFDDYLSGSKNALNDQELRGMKKFMHMGCVSCHNGVAVGGNSYQKLGVVIPYKTKDLGRYNVTKKDYDKMVFKVPSLRNIAETGPYFHDGSVKTLDKAIELMAKHQLGRNVGPGFITDVAAFLKTLTGEAPKF